MRAILDQRGLRWERCGKGAVGRERGECGMLVTFRWHSAAVCHHTLQAINLTNVLLCAEGASTALHVWLFGEAFWQGASCPARAIITNGLSGVVPKLPAMVHIGFGIWHLALVCCIQCFFISAFACHVSLYIFLTNIQYTFFTQQLDEGGTEPRVVMFLPK